MEQLNTAQNPDDDQVVRSQDESVTSEHLTSTQGGEIMPQPKRRYTRIGNTILVATSGSSVPTDKDAFIKYDVERKTAGIQDPKVKKRLAEVVIANIEAANKTTSTGSV
ncbi:hypothetical protein [Rhodococcus ruber]|uniref:hypothetical protein n=1 Tax=Rhodococcus ruber TaxID=1830 RepID=UPI000F5311E2|nr:hypothetical protein [Rhodococcus ruber]